jgi:hypothetical protein
MRQADVVDTPAGEAFEIPAEPGQDVVVLCDLTEDGLRPFEVLFAHEVLVAAARRRLSQPGVRAVIALPLRRQDYVLLAAPPETARRPPDTKRAKVRRA